jgi:hypothetical protein
MSRDNNNNSSKRIRPDGQIQTSRQNSNLNSGAVDQRDVQATSHLQFGIRFPMKVMNNLDDVAIHTSDEMFGSPTATLTKYGWKTGAWKAHSSVNIGNYSIPCTLIEGVNLTPPLKELLTDRAFIILKYARSIAKMIERTCQTDMNVSKRNPFGNLSVQEPSKTGLYNCSPQLHDEFNGAIEALNTEYIMKTNLIAKETMLKSIHQTFIDLNKECLKFEAKCTAILLDTIDGVPSDLLDFKHFKTFAFWSVKINQTFTNVFEMEMQALMDSVFARSAKKASFNMLKEEADQQIKDPATSLPTIKGVVTEIVRQQLLLSGNSKGDQRPAPSPPKSGKTTKKQPKKKTASKTTAPPKPKPGKNIPAQGKAKLSKPLKEKPQGPRTSGSNTSRKK